MVCVCAHVCAYFVYGFVGVCVLLFACRVILCTNFIVIIIITITITIVVTL